MRRVSESYSPRSVAAKRSEWLPNRAWPRARAREEGRAFVEGNPVDRDVGVERVEIGLDARAQKRRDADERTVEPDSGLISAVERARLGTLGEGQRVSFEVRPGRDGRTGAEDLAPVD